MSTASNKELQGKNLIYWLVITVCLIIATMLFIFVNGYQEREAKINKQKYDLFTDDVRADIKYYDESLSMSARLFALTGDQKWQTRYEQHELKLKEAVNKVKIESKQIFNELLFAATEPAAHYLRATEAKAINQQQRSAPIAQASPLLDESYRRDKQAYGLRFNYFSAVADNAVRLNQLQAQIAYIDEVLTMSARMAAYTGDNYWRERYDRMVVILDASIAEALKRTNNENLASYLTAVSDANNKLIALELQAFSLVQNQQLSSAVKVLFGSDYLTQKDIYAQGIEKFSVAINDEVNKSISTTEQYIKIEAIVVFVVLSAFTLYIFYLATRIKAWEKTLKKRNTELEKKKNELEVFSYSMSHDLKAPLKSIQGFAKRIDKFTKKEQFDNIAALNEHVILNAEKLDKLVDDITEIIKAEQINDLTEEVDFTVVADNITDDINLLENKHNVEFIADFNHTGNIFCHRHSLYQILINLVSNSVKYAKDDIDDAFVKLETTTITSDILNITISDNGIGINESMHDRVFTMFFRESSNHSFGAGLGLYLVKKQIENMGGTISFSSNNKGTIFSMEIPIKPKNS